MSSSIRASVCCLFAVASMVVTGIQAARAGGGGSGQLIHCQYANEQGLIVLDYYCSANCRCAPWWDALTQSWQPGCDCTTP